MYIFQYCLRSMTIALLTLICGTTAAQQTTPQIAYLRFEEGCGNSTLNEASTGYTDCTLTGSAAFYDYSFLASYSAAMMGTGSGTDRCDTTIALPGSGDWTIEALVTYPAGGTGGIRYLFGNSAVFNGGFRCFRSIGTAPNDLMLRGVPVEVPLTGMSPGSLPFTVNHIAFVYDDAAQTITPYLDGVAQPGVPQGSAVNLPASTLAVGGHSNQPSWGGEIDEFRFWSEARSAVQLNNVAYLGDLIPGPELTINGILPTGFHREVEIDCPFDVTIRIDGHATTPLPLVLLAGVGYVCNGIPTPWGGAIEIGGPIIVADGLNPSSALDFIAKTNFELSFQAPAWMVGAAGPSIQAIVVDGNNPPFNLKNTNWGAPTFTGSTVTGYVGLSDDQFVVHTLASGSIDFGGVSYTTVFIGANGQITFGAGSTDYTPSVSEFFGGFQGGATSTANPGVATIWADYCRSGVDDDITVCESGSPSRLDVVISYNNQEHWDSATLAGSWSCSFTHDGNDDIVSIDLTNYRNRISGVDKDPLLGVTDGDNTDGGVDSDFNLTTNNFYMTNALTSSESICEQFGVTAGSNVDFNTIKFVETSAFHWLVLVDL